MKYDPKDEEQNKYHKPICSYCRKKLRKGSHLDHLWPHYDDENYHWACFNKEWGVHYSSKYLGVE